jgi:murein L,D-transpeptidase YafK
MSLAMVQALATVSLTALCAHAAGARDLSDERIISKLMREPITITVFKQKRELGVYQFGKLKHRYPIVLGRNPTGRKLYEGDMRPPEGFYRVTTKRDHPRWRHFIAIDYPNDTDRRAYQRAVKRNLIPLIKGEPLGIGGDLGIHGNDNRADQDSGVDWTRGCIAMDNDDLDKIHALVRRGTPVLILEGDEPIADNIRAMIDSRRAVSTADTQ